MPPDPSAVLPASRPSTGRGPRGLQAVETKHGRWGSTGTMKALYANKKRKSTALSTPRLDDILQLPSPLPGLTFSERGDEQPGRQLDASAACRLGRSPVDREPRTGVDV